MKKCLFALIAITVLACNKNKDDQNNQPVIQQKDTLATGWSIVPVQQNYFGSDIFFINNTLGFLIGKNWITHSTNGGKTWDSVYYQPNTEFVSIGMGDANHAVFLPVPAPGTGIVQIVKTDNGGASFSKVTIADHLLSNVFFVSPTVVYAVGQKCWKSTDAGSTWTSIFDFGTANSANYRGLFFIDAQTGWTTAPTGIFKTTNGGVNWQLASPSPLFISELFFTEANTGFVSDTGRLSKTIDGGSTLNFQKTLNGGYHDIHFVSTTTGYISDRDKIFKTTDGGFTWTKEVDLVSGTIGELHFTDAYHGWACLDIHSAILRYEK